MDEVVAEAERRHVGIIASLMWMESAIACYVKEKAVRDGDTGSKTMALPSVISRRCEAVRED